MVVSKLSPKEPVKAGLFFKFDNSDDGLNPTTMGVFLDGF